MRVGLSGDSKRLVPPLLIEHRPNMAPKFTQLRASDSASQPAMLHAKPGSPRPDNLCKSLAEIALRPLKNLVPPWSWKAVALAALLRGITYRGRIENR
jgi:hypothetical protein